MPRNTRDTTGLLLSLIPPPITHPELSSNALPTQLSFFSGHRYRRALFLLLVLPRSAPPVLVLQELHDDGIELRVQLRQEVFCRRRRDRCARSIKIFPASVGVL